MSHPEDEQLLRYADGESPARSANRIREHLKACWECRAAVEEQQATVGECVRYRKNVLQRHLPPPPQPWTDIYRGFAEIDAALDRASLWERAMRILQAPMRNVSRWAPVAVALALVVVVTYRFRQTPSVQAAELLRKAVAAADGVPQKPRRIQIRTRDRQLTVQAGPQKKLALNAADTESLRSLEALFQAAHYDWVDPLSAKSYQIWRDQLSEKRDEVVEEPGVYRIRTRAGSGELTAATLTIRRRDLRPVEERFEFSNREWVEIAELAEQTAPDAITAAEANPIDTHSTASVSPDRTPLPAPSSFATMGDELHVLAALNRVGADLGDPIEVSRAGSEILVTGVGIAPQRQQEIHDALSSQTHVVVRFSESPPAAVEPDSPKRQRGDAVGPVNPDIPQRQSRLAEQIGGRVYFAQLAAQILDLSEPMMSRAYALKRLAERFPMTTEPQLGAQDRQLLRSLRHEHTEGLRRQTAEIDRLLRPALAPVTGSARLEPAGIPLSGVWQPATEELFQSARRVEKMLALLFGAAAGEAPDETLPSQLLSNLAQLSARLEAYDRMPTQPPERSIK